LAEGKVVSDVMSALEMPFDEALEYLARLEDRHVRRKEEMNKKS
jgi:hypothetical protein